MRLLLRRSLEPFQTRGLDGLDLRHNQLQPLHIAQQLGQRVGRDRCAFGRAQAFKLLGRIAPPRIEVADPKSDQVSLVWR